MTDLEACPYSDEYWMEVWLERVAIMVVSGEMDEREAREKATKEVEDARRA